MSMMYELKKCLLGLGMFLFTFCLLCCNQPEEEVCDSLEATEYCMEDEEPASAEEDQEQLSKEDYYGYWSNGTEELLVGENELWWVYERVLEYHGPYSIGESGSPLFFDAVDDPSVVSRVVFIMYPGGLGTGEESVMKKDPSKDRITWDYGSREQKEQAESYLRQQEQQQQSGNQSSIGVFRKKSDVYRYLETYSFRDSKGFGIRISSPGSVWFSGLSSGDGISCGFSTTEVTIYSEHVAFLKNRDYNGEGWEATVNSERGTIEFGWAGLRDHSYRNAIPSYDVFYKK